MSETEGDREFFAAAEAAFIRRRGTPFLLSPKDFELLKEWRALGVPIEAIEQGIEDAFSRREERSAVGRVNSLSYCRDAVLLAWERRSEAMVGRGTGRAMEAPPTAVALGAFAHRLGEIASERPELAASLDSARKSLARLADSERDPVSVEESLVRLDKKLANAVYEALGQGDRDRIDADVAQQLARARVRMDDETAEKTSRALRRRAVREAVGLPRLSLL